MGMGTPSKPKSSLQGKPSARSSAEPLVPSPTKPFLRFYHSEALRKKTLFVLDTIENAEDAIAHRDKLAEVVVELMSSGMDYYFMRSLKLAKVGFIVMQSARLGMAGTQQVMGSVIRNIIGRMDTSQLLSVCGSIRRLMV
jgi:hypothetical protein